MVPSKSSKQHSEVGSFALRLLWIPAFAALGVIAYLSVQTPTSGRAPTVTVATANEMAPLAAAIAPAGAGAASAAPAVDDAVAAHQALDPVGAGSTTR